MTQQETVQKAMQKDRTKSGGPIAFTEMPDVLIQDPIRHRWFLVPGSKFESFRTSPNTWQDLGPNTVTFVIPDDEVVGEIPPFVQATDALPDVLVHWPRGNKSYLISYKDLQGFEVAAGAEKDVSYGISFLIPRGTELIDELPPLRAALLQSGESAFHW